jgi:DNA-binding SARP family transcriptional activator
MSAAPLAGTLMEAGVYPSTGESGVPDYGAGVTRGSLLQQLAAVGTRPTVVVGPSGAGKTLLVAQYAARSESVVVWLSAEGAFLSASEMCDRSSAALGVGAQVGRLGNAQSPSRDDSIARLVDAVRGADCGAGVCIVLDDLGAEPGADGLDHLQHIATALWRSGTRLLITTRSVSAWPPAARCQWVVLDEHDLALSDAEAEELVAQLGVRILTPELEELRSATGGHVALFAAMAMQASRHGLAPSSPRVLSLDAWLERVLSGLTNHDANAVELAAALKVGTERDLLGLGVERPKDVLRRIARMLPLVHIATDEGGWLAFRVHDLVDEFMAEHRPTMTEQLHERVLSVLLGRGDYARACELLVRLGDDGASGRWLARHGAQAFRAGHLSALDRLLSSVPVSTLMLDAGTLVLWSRVCCETGRYEESVAKARAARLLADHERNWPAVRGAIAQTLFALPYVGKQDEADALAEEVIASKAEYVDELLLAEALFRIGRSCVVRGELSSAEPPLHSALDLCRGRDEATTIAKLAQQGIALMPAMMRGNFQSSRRALAVLMDDPADLPSTRIMVKGNMALCSVECGRTERAESLVMNVIAEAERYGLEAYAGAYLPILGMIMYLRGNTVGGIEQMRRGVALSVGVNDKGHAAADRIWLSQALRAAGDVEASLTEAEKSFEALSVRDVNGLRRQAEFEIAGSLLAGDDVSAARTWVERAQGSGSAGNPFHTIRAALLLAECDRREGDVGGAVQRLVAYSDYVRSENPNLLLAMYCRAFPGLLGLLALAAGTESLPVHMLRLIPPEQAEIALVEIRAWLDDSVWRALGVRLLGDCEFGEFLARDGLPLCHVRFFGGLEVSIGSRSISERDWRKRKARLLCAMLVLRRGQDVPREQLFDHLFPDMDPERAKNNLYVVWSTMKSVLLGDGAKGSPLPYFEAIGGVCRAVRANIRSDVDDFDKLIRSAAECEMASEFGAALRIYEHLSSLYRGELLPGDVYDDWFAEMREHYRVAFVGAMLSASTILMNADDPGNALVYARRAIQADPLREDLYQAALRCQIAGGQRSGAIDTYLQCRSRLADDLGLDPSRETRALYDEILAMEDRPRITPLDPLVC